MIQHLQPTPGVPSRVVVLGASGFVGRHLVAYLTDLKIETLPRSSSEIDLLQPDSVELLGQLLRPDDSLVVTSAITPDRGRDIPTLMCNLTMGAHLGACLEHAACAHVVYISSDAVYEDDANPVQESSCCNPSTFHGLMHLARERMLAYAAQRSGTPLLVLRPSLLYGPEDTHNSYGPNRFLRTALSERTITLFGDGEEKRDHVYIKDLSRLVGLCLAHRSQGVLNVATGRSVSFLEVAQEVIEACGTDVSIERLQRAVPVTYRHFDIASLLRAFPSFRFTPMRDGLVVTVKTAVATGS